MTHETKLVTVKEFAKIIARSESRLRAIVSENSMLMPKPVIYGKHVAGGRVAHQYSLEDLQEFMVKVKNKPKAIKKLKSSWEGLF